MHAITLQFVFLIFSFFAAAAPSPISDLSDYSFAAAASFSSESSLLLPKFRRMIRDQVEENLSTFPSCIRPLSPESLLISPLDHLEIFMESFHLSCSDDSDAFLFEYMEFILSLSLDAVCREKILQILDELVVCKAKLELIQLVINFFVLKDTREGSIVACLSLEEEKKIYMTAILTYKDTHLDWFKKLIIIFADLIPRCLITHPVYRFNCRDNLLQASAWQVILHFGPLIASLRGIRGADEEIRKVFIINGKTVFWCPVLIKFFDMLHEMVPVKSFSRIQDVTRTHFPFIIGGEFKVCEYSLINSCLLDLPFSLNLILQVSGLSELTWHELAYLFVQARNSKHHRIHLILISTFTITLTDFELFIFPILNSCLFSDEEIDTLRMQIITNKI